MATPAPSTEYAFRRLLTQRGELVVTTLLEHLDEYCPVGKEQILFRQLRLTKFFAFMRDLSEIAMDTMANCLARNIKFQLHLSVDPKARTQGERIDLRCYPGEGWVFDVRHAGEESRALSTPVEADGKRSSSEGLRSSGSRR